jgi:hypothetical protein
MYDVVCSVHFIYTSYITNKCAFDGNIYDVYIKCTEQKTLRKTVVILLLGRQLQIMGRTFCTKYNSSWEGHNPEISSYVFALLKRNNQQSDSIWDYCFSPCFGQDSRVNILLGGRTSTRVGHFYGQLLSAAVCLLCRNLSAGNFKFISETLVAYAIQFGIYRYCASYIHTANTLLVFVLTRVWDNFVPVIWTKWFECRSFQRPFQTCNCTPQTQTLTLGLLYTRFHLTCV